MSADREILRSWYNEAAYTIHSVDKFGEILVDCNNCGGWARGANIDHVRERMEHVNDYSTDECLTLRTEKRLGINTAVAV